MELSDDDVCLSVTNQGAELEPNPKTPKVKDVRGRGLEIAGALGDLSIEHDDGTTTVSVNIPLSAKGEEKQST